MKGLAVLQDFSQPFWSFCCFCFQFCFCYVLACCVVTFEWMTVITVLQFCVVVCCEDFFSYSIEYRVKKGEFRVIKVEYRVIKVEYRVIKVEYRVMKVEYRVIKVEYRVIKSEYRVIKSEYRVLKSEYRVIKQNKKTIGCSTRSHTWRSHVIKKTYFKKITRQIDMVKIKPLPVQATS